MSICRLPRVAARKRRQKPPLCKGRWIAARRDGGIACGRLCCHELRSAGGGNPSAPAGQLPLHKGAFVFAAARMGSLRQSEPAAGRATNGRPYGKCWPSRNQKAPPSGELPRQRVRGFARPQTRPRATVRTAAGRATNGRPYGKCWPPRNQKALPPGELLSKVTERFRASVGS